MREAGLAPRMSDSGFLAGMEEVGSLGCEVMRPLTGEHIVLRGENWDFSQLGKLKILLPIPPK